MWSMVEAEIQVKMKWVELLDWHERDSDSSGCRRGGGSVVHQYWQGLRGYRQAEEEESAQLQEGWGSLKVGLCRQARALCEVRAVELISIITEPVEKRTAVRILSETVKINMLNAEVLIGKTTSLWRRVFTQLVLEM